MAKYKKRGVRFFLNGLGSPCCERDRVELINENAANAEKNYAALLRIKKTFKASRPTKNNETKPGTVIK